MKPVEVKPTKVIPAFGQVDTWNNQVALTAIFVGTFVFATGNIAAFQANPVVTIGFNALFIYAICITAKLIAFVLRDRFSEDMIGYLVFTFTLLASIARGYAIDLVFNLINYEDGQSGFLRAIWSLSVFFPGFVLSVAVVCFIKNWREDEQHIRELIEQRNQLVTEISSEVNDYLKQISILVKDKLEPKLAQITTLSKSDAQATLKDMVDTVVRPISHNLNNETPNLVSLRPSFQRVSLQDFNTQALMGKPLAPVLTGIIFGLLLLPRNLVFNPVLTGLFVCTSVGLAIGVGNWLTNLISKVLLRRLNPVIHLAAISLLLILLGASLGIVSQAITPETLGYDQLYLTGAVASLLLSLLVGGIVNARQYFAAQRQIMAELEYELDLELTKARQIQWQRNQSMSKWLHGPMQGALNSAVIRISRSNNPAEFDHIKNEIATDVKQMLNAIDQADAEETDLAVVIERVSDTWQDICQITWSVNDALVKRVTNTPATAAIADVLVEAVFNAIKHASPEKIDISLGYNANNAIELNVRHAGLPSYSENAGLGTKIYDNLTLSHSLTDTDGEITFKATFPSN